MAWHSKAGEGVNTKANWAYPWQGAVTGRMKSGIAHTRVEDHEILFTTLLLWLGPPPRSRQSEPDTTSQVFQKYVYDYSSWAREAKDAMRELGHNPHQGLFTEFAHWFETQWEGGQR